MYKPNTHVLQNFVTVELILTLYLHIINFTGLLKIAFSLLDYLTPLPLSKGDGSLSASKNLIFRTPLKNVVRPGFEPGLTESKSVVLPLHHRTILISVCP